MLGDRIRAVRVLAHRGMIEPLRPDRAVHAFLAIRRNGPFGGLIAHAAVRYGDAPAVTDEHGTLSFAVDDIEFGKRLCAFVVAAPDSRRDADDIRSYVRSHLARHKVPRDVLFVEALPRNETGKLL